MDEGSVREHANQHANAVKAGDMGTAAKDLTDEGKAAAPAVMKGMPRPVTEVEVVKVEDSGDRFVAHIAYRGEGAEHMVASHWEDRDGRPMIVDLTVVEG
jgi:hypothetical protein